MVFLGEAGFFASFDITTFFLGIVIPFNATTFFVGVIVMTAGCLVNVDVFPAPFLIGVKPRLSSSWE
jgi:hypothetical protein